MKLNAFNVTYSRSGNAPASIKQEFKGLQPFAHVKSLLFQMSTAPEEWVRPRPMQNWDLSQSRESNISSICTNLRLGSHSISGASVYSTPSNPNLYHSRERPLYGMSDISKRSNLNQARDSKTALQDNEILFDQLPVVADHKDQILIMNDVDYHMSLEQLEGHLANRHEPTIIYTIRPVELCSKIKNTTHTMMPDGKLISEHLKPHTGTITTYNNYLWTYPTNFIVKDRSTLLCGKELGGTFYKSRIQQIDAMHAVVYLIPIRQISTWQRWLLPFEPSTIYRYVPANVDCGPDLYVYQQVNLLGEDPVIKFGKCGTYKSFTITVDDYSSILDSVYNTGQPVSSHNLARLQGNIINIDDETAYAVVRFMNNMHSYARIVPPRIGVVYAKSEPALKTRHIWTSGWSPITPIPPSTPKPPNSYHKQSDNLDSANNFIESISQYGEYLDTSGTPLVVWMQDKSVVVAGNQTCHKYISVKRSTRDILALIQSKVKPFTNNPKVLKWRYTNRDLYLERKSPIPSAPYLAPTPTAPYVPTVPTPTAPYVPTTPSAPPDPDRKQGAAPLTLPYFYNIPRKARQFSPIPQLDVHVEQKPSASLRSNCYTSSTTPFTIKGSNHVSGTEALGNNPIPSIIPARTNRGGNLSGCIVRRGPFSHIRYDTQAALKYGNEFADLFAADIAMQGLIVTPMTIVEIMAHQNTSKKIKQMIAGYKRKTTDSDQDFSKGAYKQIIAKYEISAIVKPGNSPNFIPIAVWNDQPSKVGEIRVIFVSLDVAKLRCCRYSYSWGEMFKSCRFYGFRDNASVMARVMKVGQDAINNECQISEADASKMDAHWKIIHSHLDNVALVKSLGEDEAGALEVLLSMGDKVVSYLYGEDKFKVAVTDNNTSGNCLTAVRNCTCAARVIYTTYRLMGYTEDEAYEMIGIIAGDDVATVAYPPKVFDPTPDSKYDPQPVRLEFSEAIKSAGTIFGQNYIHSFTKDHLKFLSRVYYKPSLKGAPSIRDVPRAICKLYSGRRGQGLTQLAQLYIKCMAAYMFDNNTYLLSVLCKNVMRIFTNLVERGNEKRFTQNQVIAILGPWKYDMIQLANAVDNGSQGDWQQAWVHSAYPAIETENFCKVMSYTKNVLDRGATLTELLELKELVLKPPPLFNNLPSLTSTYNMYLTQSHTRKPAITHRSGPAARYEVMTIKSKLKSGHMRMPDPVAPLDLDKNLFLSGFVNADGDFDDVKAEGYLKLEVSINQVFQNNDFTKIHPADALAKIKTYITTNTNPHNHANSNKVWAEIDKIVDTKIVDPYIYNKVFAIMWNNGFNLRRMQDALVEIVCRLSKRKTLCLTLGGLVTEYFDNYAEMKPRREKKSDSKLPTQGSADIKTKTPSVTHNSKTSKKPKHEVKGRKDKGRNKRVRKANVKRDLKVKTPAHRASGPGP
jgi:hypothetical protein